MVCARDARVAGWVAGFLVKGQGTGHLASSPSEKVSDFPLSKMVSGFDERPNSLDLTFRTERPNRLDLTFRNARGARIGGRAAVVDERRRAASRLSG